ncbi:MAG: DUF805 domain-containing protein [Acidimicrobiales bacterium]|jgi:uncharacterized membrane protein YhaH (DUF805 family)
MVSFTEAIRTCFQKYATFSGAATRAEYWWFALFIAVVDFLLFFTRVPALSWLWFVMVIVPALAVTARRHHDAGRSAWWILTGFIWPWSLVLVCYPSKMVNNKYVEGRSGDQYALNESNLSANATSCPSCGKMRLPGQNYCMGCGAKLGA